MLVVHTSGKSCVLCYFEWWSEINRAFQPAWTGRASLHVSVEFCLAKIGVFLAFLGELGWLTENFIGPPAVRKWSSDSLSYFAIFDNVEIRKSFIEMERGEKSLFKLSTWSHFGTKAPGNKRVLKKTRQWLSCLRNGIPGLPGWFAVLSGRDRICCRFCTGDAGFVRHPRK